MDKPVNSIGAAGAAALVEGLKEMTNLTQLNLGSEFCISRYCLLRGCDELDQTGCWCAHGEGAGGQEK